MTPAVGCESVDMATLLGGVYYPQGDFDPTSGFIRVGGTGRIPTFGGGVGDVSGDGSFITPFDVFSLRVRPIAVINDFTVRVVPSNDPESVLAYGEDDPVPPEQVLLDRDATIRLNVIGENRAPVVGVNPLPWKDRRLDVSGDDRITAQDALQVINSLGKPIAAASGASMTLSKIDTNEDGIASAADALLVINYLIRQDARSSLTLLRDEARDLSQTDDSTDLSHEIVDQLLDAPASLF